MSAGGGSAYGGNYEGRKLNYNISEFGIRLLELKLFNYSQNIFFFYNHQILITWQFIR